MSSDERNEYIKKGKMGVLPILLYSSSISFSDSPVLCIMIAIGIPAFFKLRASKQFFGDFPGVFVYLREVSQPQHLHFSLAVTVGSKFGKLHKYQVQPLYHLVRMLHVHQSVIRDGHIRISLHFDAEKNILYRKAFLKD